MFAQMSKKEVIAACEKAVLPFSPVVRPEQLFDDPHLNATGGLLTTTLPDGSPVKLPRTPVKASDHDFGIRNDPPAVGADTDDLLRELGYTDDTIAQLREEVVVV